MPICNYCGTEYTPKLSNAMTCGAKACQRKRASERNLAWDKKRRAQLGKALGFGLGYCPWETGQLKPSGREPDFGLGF